MDFNGYESRAEICEFGAPINIVKIRKNTNNKLNGAWRDHARHVEWAACVVGAGQLRTVAATSQRERRRHLQQNRATVCLDL